MRKRAYARPALVQYGAVSSLTLGAGGHRPDFLGTTHVNDNCFTFGSAGFCQGIP